MALERTEGECGDGVLGRQAAQLRCFHHVLVLRCPPRLGPFGHNHAAGGSRVGGSRRGDVEGVGVCGRRCPPGGRGGSGGGASAQLLRNLRGPASGQRLQSAGRVQLNIAQGSWNSTVLQEKLNSLPLKQD